ncbi:ornithine carbamoyltransferase [Bacillus sp. FJAT-27264]|uniref:ornithine carbamoyltransferase n=1 Tax=Paenibacillus sp. (strain DSM 101736 / FJAT-27264) TaxID=1850362 RepID=UPI000807E5F0|nr:ornithine carbamoyltransferase [Bacillus sp. FJAT-27264]OBZ14420.1 ornithine carbamoyltransferase [Bacillus sp. FJAT-27264]
MHHLLDLESLTPEQINEIFALTDQLRLEQPGDPLHGKTFALFFPETSLRTRITFEKGIYRLGGQSLLFPPETLDRPEALSDVIQYLQNWADGVIVRHASFSKLVELSAHASIPVINAMTADNHPCEILSDLYSIHTLRENYRDLVYTFVGPATNISRSWASIAKIMDLTFYHVCTEGNEIGESSRNYTFHTDLEAILPLSDVILTDSLRPEFLTEEYISKYQITLERMQLTRKDAMFNPCPPFFRNEELSEDVISSRYFVGYGFKKNLLFLQQAVILYSLD